jgi:hypothetical protein
MKLRFRSIVPRLLADLGIGLGALGCGLAGRSSMEHPGKVLVLGCPDIR